MQKQQHHKQTSYTQATQPSEEALGTRSTQPSEEALRRRNIFNTRRPDELDEIGNSGEGLLGLVEEEREDALELFGVEQRPLAPGIQQERANLEQEMVGD